MVPPPAMGRRRGGHPHSGVLLVACWVRHPTEWGGEENVVPPARDGQEARWTPLCGVLLMEACWEFVARGAMTFSQGSIVLFSFYI